MVDWFGSARYGVANPIKEMMKPGFQEPPCNLSFQERIDKFGPNVTVLDCYIERADGYSYGSQDILRRQKMKGLLKRVGPYDMYVYPGARSMDYGWFLCDPELKNETWHRPSKCFSMQMTEISRFLKFALSRDKFFKF